jgi:hypothetical protein
MIKDRPCRRAEAYAALEALKELVSKTRTDAMFDVGGVGDKLSDYDNGNTVSTNHYMMALNALDNAALHLSSAILTLGE